MRGDCSREGEGRKKFPKKTPRSWGADVCSGGMEKAKTKLRFQGPGARRRE